MNQNEDSDDVEMNFISIDLNVKRGVSFEKRTVQVRNGIIRYFKPNNLNEIRFQADLNDVCLIDENDMEFKNGNEIVITSQSNAFPLIRLSHSDIKILKSFKLQLRRMIIREKENKKENEIKEKENKIKNTIKLICEKYNKNFLNDKSFETPNTFYIKYKDVNDIEIYTDDIERIRLIDKDNIEVRKVNYLRNIMLKVINEKRNGEFFLFRFLFIYFILILLIYAVYYRELYTIVFIGFVTLCFFANKHINFSIVGSNRKESNGFHMKQCVTVDANYFDVFDMMIRKRNNVYFDNYIIIGDVSKYYILEADEMLDKTKISLIAYIEDDFTVEYKTILYNELNHIANYIKYNTLNSLFDNKNSIDEMTLFEKEKKEDEVKKKLVDIIDSSEYTIISNNDSIGLMIYSDNENCVKSEIIIQNESITVDDLYLYLQNIKNIQTINHMISNITSTEITFSYKDNKITLSYKTNVYQNIKFKDYTYLFIENVSVNESSLVQSFGYYFSKVDNKVKVGYWIKGKELAMMKVIAKHLSQIEENIVFDRENNISK